jgi:hypothetical protein
MLGFRSGPDDPSDVRVSRFVRICSQLLPGFAGGWHRIQNGALRARADERALGFHL